MTAELNLGRQKNHSKRVFIYVRLAPSIVDGKDVELDSISRHRW